MSASEEEFELSDVNSVDSYLSSSVEYEIEQICPQAIKMHRVRTES